ncbi:MAG: DUF4364 family protein [Oscillospiraceae bacterium]
MEREVFGAGVAPGSPTTPNEVKTLLCWLLDNTGAEMSFAQLHEALAAHNLVNYFELVQDLEQLVETGHLIRRLDGETEQFSATQLGRETGQELASTLPLAVREKALESAKLALRRTRRLREVNALVEKLPDGFKVHLSIPDQGSGLIDLTLFAPTEREAQEMRRRFLNDPVVLYKSVLALFSGRLGVLGELSEEEEELFPVLE